MLPGRPWLQDHLRCSPQYLGSRDAVKCARDVGPTQHRRLERRRKQCGSTLTRLIPPHYVLSATREKVTAVAQRSPRAQSNRSDVWTVRENLDTDCYSPEASSDFDHGLREAPNEHWHVDRDSGRRSIHRCGLRRSLAWTAESASQTNDAQAWWTDLRGSGRAGLCSYRPASAAERLHRQEARRKLNVVDLARG